MVTGTTGASLSSLDPFFAQIISQQLALERQQKVGKYTDESETIDVKVAVFHDLENSFEELQSAVNKLQSQDSNYVLETANKATISDQTNEATVITATNDETAIAGSYKIEVTQLARQHQMASDQYADTNAALGILGSLTINDQTVSVATTDTLLSISSKINSVSFAEGEEVAASIVDGRLVLQAGESGTANSIVITDTSDALLDLGFTDGLGDFQYETTARDATFSVNGLSITRSSNTEIDDVIEGVEFDLARDAEGNSATLEVGTDLSTMKTAVTGFINKFNNIMTYLENKTKITVNEDQTVTREALSGDLTWRSVRGELTDQILFTLTDETFSSFAELGIGLDDDLKLSIEDNSLFESVMKNDFEDVTAFFDAKMTNFQEFLDGYVGSSGVVTYTQQNLDEQKDYLSERIEKEEARISRSEQLLIKQYAELQSQIEAMQNNLNMFGSLSSNMNIQT